MHINLMNEAEPSKESTQATHSDELLALCHAQGSSVCNSEYFCSMNLSINSLMQFLSWILEDVKFSGHENILS